MQPTVSHEMVPIDLIELDRTNPRISKWVEMYGGDITDDRLRLALLAESADERDGNTTTVGKLKQSIQTNGGVVQPVILNRLSDGRLVCVEGNTRVKLYQEFREHSPDDARWQKILSIVHSGLTRAQIDAIRLQVHLVGPRQWDPYSKAKYLARLRNEEHLPFSEIVDYCGGRQKEIEEQIVAYEEMEKYYRAVIPDDGAFETKRFSGFVELQAYGIKTAIADAGFGLLDFATWVHTKQFNRLEDIRQLPRILKHPEARKAFLKDGSRKALEQLQRPDVSKTLMEADVLQLARALNARVQDVSVKELLSLRDDEAMNELLDARDSIKFLLKLLNSQDLVSADDE